MFSNFFSNSAVIADFFAALVMRLRTTLTRSGYKTFQKRLDPDPDKTKHLIDPDPVPDPDKTKHLIDRHNTPFSAPCE